MEREIATTINTLNKEGTILYPTDTVWGLGCDATNELAVSKIYDIKNRAASKSLIVLVDSVEMLSTYVKEIPGNVGKLLNEATRPTTIIYRNPIGLAQNVIALDNTVAIRIAQDSFCKALIRTFKKPIVSTSANRSGAQTPMSYEEIDESILHAVDYVVNLHRDAVATTSSRILRICEDGSVEVLRD